MIHVSLKHVCEHIRSVKSKSSKGKTNSSNLKSQTEPSSLSLKNLVLRKQEFLRMIDDLGNIVIFVIVPVIGVGVNSVYFSKSVHCCRKGVCHCLK